MVITKTSDVHLNTLSSIKQSLRRSRNADDLRRVQVQLNNFSSSSWDEASHEVRATFLLLGGALWSKAGRTNQSAWLRTSGHQCLQHALGLYQRGIEEIRAQQREAGPTMALVELEQLCTYEAHVAYSYLRLWGEQPDVLIGTDALSKTQKRKEESSRKHGHSLTSAF